MRTLSTIKNQCAYLGIRGGTCKNQQYDNGFMVMDFCRKHAKQTQAGKKLFCTICNGIARS